MTSPSPDFSFFASTPVVNAKTGKTYTLDKITALTPDDRTLSDLVRICNEPAIYDFLFRERLKGATYTAEDARGFLAWGSKGWAEKAYFVFIVRDEHGHIAAATDIRANTLVESEVGYWASSKHSGIMTPTLNALTKVALRAGYAALMAYVRLDNDRSRQVLLTNGFTQEPGEFVNKGKTGRHVFRKTL